MQAMGVGWALERICYRLWRAGLWVRRTATARANAALLRKLAACGEGVRLNGLVRMTGASSARFGNNIHIGDNAHIRAEGGLSIGDNTHISRNLVLYTINHDYRGKRLPYDEAMVGKPVEIGANCWLGMNVTVLPGAKIGEGAIVGAGSSVRGEVPPLAIVAPSPVRVLGHRDAEHYAGRVAQRAFGGANGLPLRGSAGGAATPERAGSTGDSA
jgi:maltose O-acetyltransferase